MEPTRAATTASHGARRLLVIGGAILVGAVLPATAMAQRTTVSGARPMRPTDVETLSSQLTSSEDLPRSAQLEIAQLLERTRRRATAATQRYAATTAMPRAQNEPNVRRDTPSPLLALARRFFQRGVLRPNQTAAVPAEGSEAYRRRGWEVSPQRRSWERRWDQPRRMDRERWSYRGGSRGPRGWVR